MALRGNTRVRKHPLHVPAWCGTQSYATATTHDLTPLSHGTRRSKFRMEFYVQISVWYHITITSISTCNIIIIDEVTIVPRELPNRNPALLLFQPLEMFRSARRTLPEASQFVSISRFQLSLNPAVRQIILFPLDQHFRIVIKVGVPNWSTTLVFDREYVYLQFRCL